MATIQGIYVALFGRPADPAGLSYFNGVTNNGTDLSKIGNLAGQTEYTGRFSGLTNTQVIDSIYQSLFNRSAEADGLKYWTDRLANGSSNINNIAISILDGAKGSDKTIVDLKVAASDLFTSHLDLPVEQAAFSGNATNIGLVRTYLASVNQTHPATADEIDALILRMVNGSGQTPTDTTPSNGGGVSGGGGGGGGGSTPTRIAADVLPGVKEITIDSFVQGVDKINVPDALLPATTFSSLTFSTVANVKSFLEHSNGMTYGTGNVAYFPTSDGKTIILVDGNHDGVVQIGGPNSDTMVTINTSVTIGASDFV